jgi:hypothetical protein
MNSLLDMIQFYFYFELIAEIAHERISSIYAAMLAACASEIYG